MTVVVARVPAGESVVRPRSRCPQLRHRDREPRQHPGPRAGCSCGGGAERAARGSRRCTRCSSSSTAVLVAGAVWRFYDDPWVAVAVAALLALMPAISVIDIAAPDHPEPDHVPEPRRVPRLPRRRPAGRRAGGPRRRMALGFLAVRRRPVRRGADLAGDGHGRREARGADRGRARRARPRDTWGSPPARRSCWAASGAVVALLLGPRPEERDPVRSLPRRGGRRRGVLGPRRSPTGTAGPLGLGTRPDQPRPRTSRSRVFDLPMCLVFPERASVHFCAL